MMKFEEIIRNGKITMGEAIAEFAKITDAEGGELEGLISETMEDILFDFFSANTKEKCGFGLLGDYIHGGNDNYRVLDKIISLQSKYGSDKVIALLGNHEDFVLTGYSTVNNMNIIEDEELGSDDGSDDKYIRLQKVETIWFFHMMKNNNCRNNLLWGYILWKM